MPQMLPESCLPLLLPEVDKFLPTETGEPPLGHATKWAWDTVNQQVVEVSKIDRKTVFPCLPIGVVHDAGLRWIICLLPALYGSTQP